MHALREKGHTISQASHQRRVRRRTSGSGRGRFLRIVLATSLGGRVEWRSSASPFFLGSQFNTHFVHVIGKFEPVPVTPVACLTILVHFEKLRIFAPDPRNGKQFIPTFLVGLFGSIQRLVLHLVGIQQSKGFLLVRNNLPTHGLRADKNQDSSSMGITRRGCRRAVRDGGRRGCGQGIIRYHIHSTNRSATSPHDGLSVGAPNGGHRNHRQVFTRCHGRNGSPPRHFPILLFGAFFLIQRGRGGR
mmetsp:Transcript_40011/g.83308  ORF Transcript_40011/g.83308 Transcript_40011/m.83308 type:complete len:246 (+) Transcript_40011:322-1059(+)